MTTAKQDSEYGTAAPAVGIPLDRPVRPLVERLHELNAIFSEDEGRDLDESSIAAALAFCKRYTQPDIVSADSTGAVYLTWRERSNLCVRFTVKGDIHWAGALPSGKRPYGSGEPDPALWACLRPNAKLRG